MFNLTDTNRKWWTLLAMSSALALVFIDQTALAVALPVIQRDLNLSNNLLQCVINAYLLALSALILLGGKIGDSLGHKRAFLFGVIVFISASILCALAQSGAWLITARALQGLGGAFMMPSTNALVINAFPEKERGKAMGIYVALAAIFLALGPLLGGALTQWFGWRAVFWINFPVAIISIVLAASAVPRWERTEKLVIDYLGVLLSMAFISGFVLSFMEGPHWGWTSPTILALFSLSLLGLIAFLFWERRFSDPLVELKLFKNPTFSIVTTVMVIIQAVGIVFVFWAIFLQSVLQYSPLGAGLLLLPSMVPIIFMAPIGGHLRDKYGPTLPMFWGCLLVILSLIWIGLFSHYQRYVWLFPGLLAYGIGMPLMLSGSMTTVMSTVSAQQRGIAGAILNCARQFGGSIGLAVLGSFLASLNTWKLTSFVNHAPGSLAHMPENLIDGLLVKSTLAMKAISHLPAQSVELLKTAALKAYTYAFSMTMFLAAAFAFICVLLILKVPRGKLSE
ncbi:MFS transporter [Rickettsiella endosymbiont of Dermanyssus gallinae]|uniref:MFS transporter n=1 Tax=Rickettsiella endosymbiont of Dermanyssus gallinae TaxID=2856608 RepID=UPI001C53174E|nr:MFS transporter [Rickettsiella endosymbiont of Dermanyssus gallinae]